MNFSTLKTEIHHEFLYCSLNRPEKRNALNGIMLQELLDLFTTLEQRKDIRGLILKGNGKVFSAGADLAMMKDVSGKTEKDLEQEAGLFYDCFDALYKLTIPAICYVHGGVHGGANGLVSACDYSLSDQNTLFSFGEVRMGLVPATVAPFVLRRTGVMNARKVMLSGSVFNASDAVRYGLVDIICSDAEAEKTIWKLIDSILENSPAAIRETKKLLIEIPEDFDGSVRREFCTGLIAKVRQSDEAREGISAFFEKRDPAWKSKTS